METVEQFLKNSVDLWEHEISPYWRLIRGASLDAHIVRYFGVTPRSLSIN